MTLKVECLGEFECKFETVLDQESEDHFWRQYFIHKILRDCPFNELTD
jgi:hypothetical protein